LSVPTVLLVRHAQASFGGADYDVLSERGVAQAAALAGDLARRGISIERVVSGSLARQRDTAEPIAAAAGCSVAVDPRWNEYDTDEILDQHSDSPLRPHRSPDSEEPAFSTRQFQEVLEGALRSWIEAGADGSTREAWPEFQARVADALAAVTARLEGGGTALVCTSGGVLAAVCVALVRTAPSALLEFNRVAVNTGVTKLILGRRGTTLVSFNDHSHLESPGNSLVTYR
jgi:broad specificity phosphatase PhoE